MYVATCAKSIKGRRLDAQDVVSLATGASGVDLVVRGSTVRIGDGDAVVAVAYRDKYHWPGDVDGATRAWTAPFRAPTAGQPPFHVYRLEAHTIHAFGTSDELAQRSSRWTLAASAVAAR